MQKIRPAAVAGTFYPSQSDALKAMIEQMLATNTSITAKPQAIIVPHAGYVYSGATAASVYSIVQRYQQDYKHIILLGPTHRMQVNGIAISGYDYFQTPFGNIAVNKRINRCLSEFPFIKINDLAHSEEHSLEVQLPFLQYCLDDFSIVPMAIGKSSPEDIAKVIEAVNTQFEHLLFVISSDLSHFHDYHTACKIDLQTAEHIENLQYQSIGYQHACGKQGINGLLYYLRHKNLSIERIALTNSGETAGDKNKVVGYASYVIH